MLPWCSKLLHTRDFCYKIESIEKICTSKGQKEYRGVFRILRPWVQFVLFCPYFALWGQILILYIDKKNSLQKLHIFGQIQSNTVIKWKRTNLETDLAEKEGVFVNSINRLGCLWSQTHLNLYTLILSECTMTLYYTFPCNILCLFLGLCLCQKYKPAWLFVVTDTPQSKCTITASDTVQSVQFSPIFKISTLKETIITNQLLTEMNRFEMFWDGWGASLQRQQECTHEYTCPLAFQAFLTSETSLQLIQRNSLNLRSSFNTTIGMYSHLLLHDNDLTT